MNQKKLLISLIALYQKERGCGPTKGEVARHLSITERAAEGRIRRLVESGIAKRSRQWRTLDLVTNPEVTDHQH